MRQHIVIVGGGLVGCVLGVHLARRGHLVEIVERSADPRKRVPSAPSRSINLTLCERGWRALERLGFDDEIRRMAVPAYGRLVHDEFGGTLYQPYGSRREAIWSISRKALHKALLSFAEAEPGVTLRFAHKCVDLDLEGPRLHLVDQTTGAGRDLRPDRIIGADGAHSEIRARLQRLDRFEYSQHYVEQGYKELNLLPDARGKAVLEPHAVHVWPRGRCMLIGFANIDGSLTLALHMPFEGDRSFASIRSPQELEDLFDELFPGMTALLPRLADDYFSRPAVSMVTVRCFPWTHGGEVALIGDAAHAIVPSYGQGANCGFEDCSVLVDCLEAAGDDWSAAFTAYQERRKADADTIAELALNHFTELQEQVSDPVFLLRKSLERRIEERCPQTYASLYSLITFTELPYTEARRRAADQGRRVEQLLDRLRAMSEPQWQLENGAMDETIHRVFQGEQKR